MLLNPGAPEAWRVYTTDGVMQSLWVPNGGGGFLILECVERQCHSEVAGEHNDEKRKNIH